MKLLLVDDHTLFREGIRHMLNALSESTCILESGNGPQALEIASQHPDLDLVLLDLNLPGPNGQDILQQFSSLHPTLPVVIISASEKPTDIQRALSNGAMGYIGKGFSSEVMLSAIRLVLAGEIYTPTSLLNASQQPGLSQPNIYSLTERQRDVLKLMDRGYANKLIADELTISEATVKMHITSIFRTLGVSNRTQAVLKAQEIGLV